jgi:hypothetical protein
MLAATASGGLRVYLESLQEEANVLRNDAARKDADIALLRQVRYKKK